ncbi:hypothetical protein F511_09090 [Dorcoceras hygrometricum]|nr:hypothetical protein F511_09090 [Dorcoceras hygrometricum]
MGARDLRAGRASLALSRARRCADDGRRWALPSRTVAGRLALLHAQESAAGLRMVAPRVVAWWRPSARDACAVIAARRCSGARDLRTGRASLALSSARRCADDGRRWALPSRTVAGRLALLHAQESAVGLRTIAPRVVAWRRPSPCDACAVVALGWPLSSAIVALLCAAGRPMISHGRTLLDAQLHAQNCWRIARLGRACRGRAWPCAARDFHGGGRRPAMLRRCRDG